MADVRRKVAVRLHVYDLIERWNDYGYLIGLGAFHSGVEDHTLSDTPSLGQRTWSSSSTQLSLALDSSSRLLTFALPEPLQFKLLISSLPLIFTASTSTAFHLIRGSVEYSYGATDADASGVFSLEPKTAPNGRFRTTVDLGEVEISPRELQRIVDEMSRQWRGNAYHLLTFNCNCFCDAFAQRLLGRGIPAWVNRAAWMSRYVQCLLPRELQEQINAPRVVAEDATPVHATSVIAFSGTGYSLSAEGGAADVHALAEESREVRRARLEQAAMRRAASREQSEATTPLLGTSSTS